MSRIKCLKWRSVYSIIGAKESFELSRRTSFLRSYNDEEVSSTENNLIILVLASRKLHCRVDDRAGTRVNGIIANVVSKHNAVNGIIDGVMV